MVLNKIYLQWLNILVYPGVANRDEIFKQKAFGTGPTLQTATILDRERR